MHFVFSTHSTCKIPFRSRNLDFRLFCPPRGLTSLRARGTFFFFFHAYCGNFHYSVCVHFVFSTHSTCKIIFRSRNLWFSRFCPPRGLTSLRARGTFFCFFRAYCGNFHYSFYVHFVFSTHSACQIIFRSVIFDFSIFPCPSRPLTSLSHVAIFISFFRSEFGDLHNSF